MTNHFSSTIDHYKHSSLTSSMQEDRIRLRWVSTALRSSGCSERNSSSVVYRKCNLYFEYQCFHESCLTLDIERLIQISLIIHKNFSNHLPLLSGPVRAASLLFYSSVQELHLLPWTQIPPVSHSALCSVGVPLPTLPLTSVVVVGPGVPVRTGGHWILQWEIRLGQPNLKAI